MNPLGSFHIQTAQLIIRRSTIGSLTIRIFVYSLLFFTHFLKKKEIFKQLYEYQSICRAFGPNFNSTIDRLNLQKKMFPNEVNWVWNQWISLKNQNKHLV